MRSHLLRSDDCVVLAVEAGDVLRCTHGQLWLTYEPGAAGAPCLDCLLVPGGEWQAPGRGTAFVTRVRSHAQAAFRVREAAPRQRARWFAGIARQVLRRLAGRRRLGGA